MSFKANWVGTGRGMEWGIKLMGWQAVSSAFAIHLIFHLEENQFFSYKSKIKPFRKHIYHSIFRDSL